MARTLFHVILLACAACSGDPSYEERLEESQRFGAEFVCPCQVADGNYESEAACQEALLAEGRGFRECQLRVYSTASDTDRAIFDCFADVQEEANACLGAGSCSDTGDCSTDVSRCGTPSDESIRLTQTCLDGLDI